MIHRVAGFLGAVFILARAASAADPPLAPALGAILPTPPLALGAGLPTPPKVSTEGLVRQTEPGSGIGVVLPDASEAELARRASLGCSVTGAVSWADPATGIVLSQQRDKISLGSVSLATTIANRGRAAVRVARIDVVDWSFRIAADSDALRYPELSHRNDTWYGSTYWTGPDWTRVGKDWHHPGENTPSVRRFTPPRDGRVTISGRVYKAHIEKTTDGVRLAVRHGPREVWRGEINGDDAQGVEPRLTLDVRQGDAVRFVVHKRGAIVCDTTHWDPLVTYSDGQSFQASKGFATSKQPGCPWSYEMEVEGPVKLGLPAVYSFRLDGSLVDATPAVDHPVSISQGETLPLVVIADGRDQSGVALAIEPGTPWQFRATLQPEGRLRLQLSAGDAKAG